MFEEDGGREYGAARGYARSEEYRMEKLLIIISSYIIYFIDIRYNIINIKRKCPFVVAPSADSNSSTENQLPKL